MPTYPNVDALSELIRKQAYYAAGGKDEGDYGLDKFNKVLGTANEGIKGYEDVVNNALAKKIKELKIGEAQYEQTPEQRGLKNRKTEAQIKELQNKHIPGAMISVKALPIEAKSRALAAGYSEDDVLEPKIFNAIRGFDPTSPIQTMKPEQALAEKMIPANTKIVDPRGLGIGDLSPGQQSAAFKLSDDFRADSADFIKKRNSFNNIISSARDAEISGAGASDLALIYAFTKLQDPTMVTEQEIQNAIRTGSFGERAKAALNSVLNGDKLTPEIRNDFVETAKKIYNESLHQQIDLQEQYKIRGDQLGIPPKLFMINYEAMDSRKPINAAPSPSTPMAPPQPTTTSATNQPKVPVIPKVGEIRKGFAFKGGDPADQKNWVRVKPKVPVIPKVGEIRKGFAFKGGDPADQKNWVRVKP